MVLNLPGAHSPPTNHILGLHMDGSTNLHAYTINIAVLCFNPVVKLQLAYCGVVKVFAFHMIINALVGAVVDLGLPRWDGTRQNQLLHRVPE
jgi:hypothetical protein